MSASASMYPADGHAAGADSFGDLAVRKLLKAAVTETVDALGAVVCGVYFVDEDSKVLCASMIGGTSPAMHAMPERIAVDDPYPTGRAFRTGQPVIMDGAAIRHIEDDLTAFLSSYSVAAAPVVQDGHRFGVLTAVTRQTQEDTPTATARKSLLRERARGLARALVPFAERGGSFGPPPWPTVVPLHRQQPRSHAPEVPGWGLPDAPGSAGHTFMFQVFKLDGSLNRALTRDDITATAQRHLMVPFKAQEMTLTGLENGRLWVAGHRGPPSPAGRKIHGSSAHGRTPAAEALRLGQPLFFADSAEKAAEFPESSDDGAEACAYLPLKGSRSPVGVCCLVFDAPRRFPAEERAVLMVMAGMLGAALERVELGEMEHALAQSLQKRLLPRTLSELPEVVVAGRYLPASPTARSGGDWYDVVRLAGDRIALIVGDVEGHGVESATVMGQVRTSLLAYLREGHTPAAVLERTSRLLADLDTELFATACVLYLDGTTCTWTGPPSSPPTAWPGTRAPSAAAPKDSRSPWTVHPDPRSASDPASATRTSKASSTPEP